MNQFKIIGILIKDRIKEAGKTQHVLTDHAEIIRSRLGFHEVSETVCSRLGVIILQLQGSPEQWEHFESDLSKIEGIEVQNMHFKY